MPKGNGKKYNIVVYIIILLVGIALWYGINTQLWKEAFTYVALAGLSLIVFSQATKSK